MSVGWGVVWVEWGWIWAGYGTWVGVVWGGIWDGSAECMVKLKLGGCGCGCGVTAGWVNGVRLEAGVSRGMGECLAGGNVGWVGREFWWGCDWRWEWRVVCAVWGCGILYPGNDGPWE